jgi:hypothetical protein
MELTRMASPPNAPLDNARDLAISAEAMRLHWNRVSQRIVRDAQERVALERPQVLLPNS